MIRCSIWDNVIIKWHHKQLLHKRLPPLKQLLSPDTYQDRIQLVELPQQLVSGHVLFFSQTCFCLFCLQWKFLNWFMFVWQVCRQQLVLVLMIYVVYAFCDWVSLKDGVQIIRDSQLKKPHVGLKCIYIEHYNYLTKFYIQCQLMGQEVLNNFFFLLFKENKFNWTNNNKCDLYMFLSYIFLNNLITLIKFYLLIITYLQLILFLLFLY